MLSPNIEVSNSLQKPQDVAKVLRFRMADIGDIPALIQLAHEAHAESRFGYIPFSEAKVLKVATAALKDEKRHAIMVAFRDDYLVGATSCSIGEFHIGTDVLLTTIHNINVRREERARLSGGRAALGLFKGVETWSRARGAREVLFQITSGIDLGRAHKLARHMGYQFIGGSYAKNVR